MGDGVMRHLQAADADSGDESDGYGEAGLSWEAVMAAVRGTDAAEAPGTDAHAAGDASPSHDAAAEPTGARVAMLADLSAVPLLPLC